MKKNFNLYDGCKTVAILPLMKNEYVEAIASNNSAVFFLTSDFRLFMMDEKFKVAEISSPPNFQNFAAEELQKLVKKTKRKKRGVRDEQRPKL